jgi:hypothetical protein
MVTFLIVPPSWLGDWCHDDLFMEDFEEARAFPFVGFLKWLWSLPSLEWRKS